MKAKYCLFYFSILIAFSCIGQKESAVVENKDSFNKNARLFYKQAAPQYSYLDEWKQCIVDETVDKYLDELNNWKLSIIDSLYIRNYFLEDLGYRFTFVAGRQGKFYFIALPVLYEYMTDDRYYERKDKRRFLRDSIQFAIAQLNNPAIDKFLNDEIFNSNVSLDRQYVRCMRVLQEMFSSYLWEEILPAAFEPHIYAEPKKNAEYILRQIGPKINQPLYDRPAGSYIRIFEFGLGYIFLDFQKQVHVDKLKLDILFIPKYRGAVTFVDPDNSVRYRECYERFNEE